MVLWFLSYTHKPAVQSRGVHDSHTQSDGWRPLHDIYRDFHWNLWSGGEYKQANTPADVRICQYRDTLSFFPMSIFCRISWWSHSCFSRTWLGNMCIPLTGWPWSWYRTGTESSAVCCPDLNLDLSSATVGLHINSCIHTTPHRDLVETVKLGSEHQWLNWLMWKMCQCERADGVKGAFLFFFFTVQWARGYCCVRGKDRLIGSLKAEAGRKSHKGGRERWRRKAGGEVEGTVVSSE